MHTSTVTIPNEKKSPSLVVAPLSKTSGAGHIVAHPTPTSQGVSSEPSSREKDDSQNSLRRARPHLSIKMFAFELPKSISEIEKGPEDG